LDRAGNQNAECRIKKLNRRGRGARREKHWKIGMMEYWNIGVLESQLYYPPFHYSIIPFPFPPLRSLLPLRSPSCLDPRKTERQRGIHIHKRICVFCLSQEKALRSLRTLRLIFSSSSEGEETFIISQSNEKGEDLGFHSEFRNPHSEFALPDGPAPFCGSTGGSPYRILFPPMLFARNPLAPGPQACFPTGKRVAKVKGARKFFHLDFLRAGNTSSKIETDSHPLNHLRLRALSCTLRGAGPPLSRKRLCRK